VKLLEVEEGILWSSPRLRGRRSRAREGGGRGTRRQVVITRMIVCHSLTVPSLHRGTHRLAKTEIILKGQKKSSNFNFHGKR
jgi:hypothetical protein